MRRPLASMMRALFFSASSNVSAGSICLGSTATSISGPFGLPTHLESDRLAGLIAERSDRLERRPVGGDELVAEQKPGLVRRQSGEHRTDEGLAVDLLGEHADAGIGDLVAGEIFRDLPAQLVGEDVGELVIGRLVARVVVRVRGAELGQHGVDGGGAFRFRLGVLVVGAVPVADCLPIEALQVTVVELVAHDAPGFVEGLRVLLGAAGGDGNARRSESENCESQDGGAEQRTNNRARAHAESSS